MIAKDTFSQGSAPPVPGAGGAQRITDDRV